MYIIEKTFTVSAAHRLELDYESPCQNWHGHNWRITVTCESPKLDGNGMVIDFKTIKQLVEKRLDHSILNEELHGMNPTAENIARWITEIIPYCVRAAVQETEGSVAVYDTRI